MNRVQVFVWNRLYTMPQRIGPLYINGSYAMVEIDFYFFSIFFGFRPWVEYKHRFVWWHVR